MADIILRDVTNLKDCVRILNGFVCFAQDDIESNHPLYYQRRYGQQQLESDSIDLVMRRILSLPPNMLDNFISVLNTAGKLIEAEEKAREAREAAKLTDDEPDVE